MSFKHSYYYWCSLKTLRWLVTSSVSVLLVLYVLPTAYRDRQHRVQLTSMNGALSSAASHTQTDKIILYWTKYFEWNDFGVGTGRTPFLRGQCETDGRVGCWTTTDRSLLNHSDAVLFHARDLDPDDLPPAGWRRPHQHFIFFNYESPVHTDLAKLRLHFNNYFNATMTYRRDSEVVSLQPYGRIKCNERQPSLPDGSPSPCLDFPLKSASDRDAHAAASAAAAAAASGSGTGYAFPADLSIGISQKNRTAAWFVSNCKTESRRESLVRNLSLYIPVDIYGECPGGRKCQNRPECDRMLSRHYRFYLSFENSLCPDYVTEKLYRALAHDTVPVVFGGADYSLYLPAGSYVDARDFESPQHLAEHIKKLMADDELYLDHFRWRRQYTVDESPLDGWCQLCQLLSDSQHADKTYQDIAAWWSGRLTEQTCFPPPVSLVSPDQQQEEKGGSHQDFYSADYVRNLVSKLRQIVQTVQTV